MSKLIKFPSQLTPTRVTPTLIRTDELLPNPVSGVQQATGNGAAYWKFSYEFKDLSESERDIVQAFLVKCKGALSSFKVEDPANYQLKGTVSSWIDVFSGYGSFNIAAGSNASLIKINSWFYGTPRFVSHITEEQVLRQEWRDYISTGNVSWAGEGSSSKVSSLDLGKAYIQRIKFFQHPTRVPTSINLRVSSGSGAYVIQSSTRVFSSDNVTAPFVVGRAVSGIGVNPVAWTTADGKVGDYFGVSDYRLSRCALVANSENLFTHSNNFGHANWIKQSAVVASGYSDKTPTGVTSGSWKLYCNTTGSGLHYASQLITKVATEDLYTLSIYAKASEMSEMYLQLDYGGGADASWATYWLSSGTATDVGEQGANSRTYADIWSVGSGWYRCQLTALVSSAGSVRGLCMLSSGNGETFAGVLSEGIEIFGAQLRQFPFMGHYIATTSASIVGTNYQTGDNLIVDGFDPGTIIKAGTRLEVVNRYNNVNSNHYERTEFKKTTEEVVSHREGWAILPVDPPIRNAPKPIRSYRQQTHLGETMHNAVIFHRPEIKVRLLGSTVQYIEKPLLLTDIVFDVIEDLTE